MIENHGGPPKALAIILIPIAVVGAIGSGVKKLIGKIRGEK